MLDEIVDVARQAADEIIRLYGCRAAAGRKSDGSPVTAADRASHECIARGLRRLGPSIPIVSEEGDVPSYAVRRTWNRFWLVDPLDGTKEFVSGNGEFTVNIALIEGGVPTLGVVIAPALELTYAAARGLGAWRQAGDEVREQLSSPAPCERTVTRVVESRSHPGARLDDYIRSLGPVERVQLGSSLKFCRVADGSADVYPRFVPAMEWDVAAGDCIMRYAGGGEAHPSPFTYNTDSLRVEGFIVPAGFRRDRFA